MTDKEDDRQKVRFVFDLFTQIQNLTYKTKAGKEMGSAVSTGIKEVLKPYMIEKSKQLL